jgi:hypothetical protein
MVQVVMMVLIFMIAQRLDERTDVGGSVGLMVVGYFWLLI